MIVESDKPILKNTRPAKVETSKHPIIINRQLTAFFKWRSRIFFWFIFIIEPFSLIQPGISCLMVLAFFLLLSLLKTLWQMIWKNCSPSIASARRNTKSPSSGPEAANRCNSKSESRKQNPQISGIDKSLSEFPCLSFQDYLTYTLFLSSIILFF